MNAWSNVALASIYWPMTPFIIIVYPMITHTLLVAGNLPIKILVARQWQTIIIAVYTNYIIYHSYYLQHLLSYKTITVMHSMTWGLCLAIHMTDVQSCMTCTLGNVKVISGVGVTRLFSSDCLNSVYWEFECCNNILVECTLCPHTG